MRGAQLPPLQERASEKSDAGLQNVPKGSKTLEKRVRATLWHHSHEDTIVLVVFRHARSEQDPLLARLFAKCVQHDF